MEVKLCTTPAHLVGLITRVYEASHLLPSTRPSGSRPPASLSSDGRTQPGGAKEQQDKVTRGGEGIGQGGHHRQPCTISHPPPPLCHEIALSLQAPDVEAWGAQGVCSHGTIQKVGLPLRPVLTRRLQELSEASASNADKPDCTVLGDVQDPANQAQAGRWRLLPPLGLSVSLVLLEMTRWLGSCI